MKICNKAISKLPNIIFLYTDKAKINAMKIEFTFKNIILTLFFIPKT